MEVEDEDISIEHPSDTAMGDYSTSIAFKYAKEFRENPNDSAEKIAEQIIKNSTPELGKVNAVNGFINFTLPRNFFVLKIQEIITNKNFGKNETLSGEKIMIEYTDPNPFKPFHIGHLMTNAIGESLARIIEFSGAEVRRANYQGDVGLHVAKAIWGLMNNAHLLADDNVPLKFKAANIGEAYALGASKYEESKEAKEQIDEINKKVYARSDELINKVYDWGFKTTMEAFEDLYRLLGTQFDFYFLESQMTQMGKDIVEENTGKIFEESDGAVVFKAQKHDPKLHTRVFITSQGLPMYETKELGLTIEKFKTYPKMTKSIVITAEEQADYMKVVAKAISLMSPEYGEKMKHITHGMMRFGKSSSGKMSSRKGNVITGESLLNDVRLSIIEKMADREISESDTEKISEAVAVAALKYSILKQSTTGDIIFDLEKSISFEGDSGPYLQYSYARANSILEKGKKEDLASKFENVPAEATEVEKLLYRFPEVVLRAAEEYAPHYIANFLIELARSFNSFYAHTQIVNKEDKESPYKLALTEAFSVVMKNGLHLLGIQAPEKM